MLRIASRAAAVCGGAWLTPVVCKPAAAPPPELTAEQLFSVQGRVALVTGGSKGLGKAVARGLAQAGCDVVISSRSEGDCQAALKEILAGTTAKGEYVVCDLSSLEEAAALGPEVLRRMGRCDIFINNAGMSRPQCIHGSGLTKEKGMQPLSDDGWQTTLQTNLSAGVTLTNALAPSMVERGWGRESPRRSRHPVRPRSTAMWPPCAQASCTSRPSAGWAAARGAAATQPARRR